MRNLLFGMSDMLANRVGELVMVLLGLIPTKYQLNNISALLFQTIRKIGIMQLCYREIKRDDEVESYN
jgi:hypothetical protein